MPRRLALTVAGLLTVAVVPVVVGSTGTAEAAVCKVAGIADVAGSGDYKTGAIPNAKMIAADTSVQKILVAGDLAYDSGSTSQYADYWRPAFGPQESKVFAAPGNHEYRTSGADGMEDELGESANDNRGVTVCGNWRVVSINSYKGHTKAADFIRAERNRHPTKHFIVMWHEPRRSSGMHGNATGVQPEWNASADIRARIVLNGHEHNYERMAPMDDDGNLVSKGTRQFVSGLGGHAMRGFSDPAKSYTQKRFAGKPGALFLTLNSDGSYGWVFRTIDGTVRDSGSQPAP